MPLKDAASLMTMAFAWCCRGVRPDHRLAAWLRRFIMPLSVLVLLAFVSEQADARYASIVIDAETNEVLYAVNADQPLFPASLTKMMTLYLTFEKLEQGQLRLDQRLPVSARAAGMTPTNLGLVAGKDVTVEDAIRGLVVRSANDASVVLAEALAGTETAFARTMTEQARSLGMANTTFRNASGLPDSGQKSTARDMAYLAQALIRDYPGSYRRYFSESSFTFNGKTFQSHNRLNGQFPGADGIKTGYIRASGFNLATSAVRDDRRLIGVVFGGQTAAARDEHMMNLLDAAFDGNTPPVLIAGGSSRAQGAGHGTAQKPSDAHAARRDTGSWAVQVGAFRNEADSRRAIAAAQGQATAQLGRATAQIVEVKAQGGGLYRARLVGLDEDTARGVCGQLARSGGDCLPISPLQR